MQSTVKIFLRIGLSSKFRKLPSHVLTSAVRDQSVMSSDQSQASTGATNEKLSWVMSSEDGVSLPSWLVCACINLAPPTSVRKC